MSSHGDLSGELQAMGKVEAALAPLSEEEKSRVLRWAGERFGVILGARPPAAANKAQSGSTTDGEAGDAGDGEKHADLAEFFAAARPRSELDKALVVGYWLQHRLGNAELEAQAVNSELKHLGHQVGNITRALGNLMAKSPQLIVQTRKSGSSKQARKKYKLTAAGKKEVEKMLASDDSDV